MSGVSVTRSCRDRRDPQGGQVELDPVKRTALLIKLNDMVLNGVTRPGVSP